MTQINPDNVRLFVKVDGAEICLASLTQLFGYAVLRQVKRPYDRVQRRS